MLRFRNSSRGKQILLSPRSIWKLSWNCPQMSKGLSWRPFSKTAQATESLLSLSYSVNSRDFGDSAGLRNNPGGTIFCGLSTARIHRILATIYSPDLDTG